MSIEKALKHPGINKDIEMKKIQECQLVISPVSLKSLHDWLGRKLIEYETLFGKIPTPEELLERAKDFKIYRQTQAATAN